MSIDVVCEKMTPHQACRGSAARPCHNYRSNAVDHNLCCYNLECVCNLKLQVLIEQEHAGLPYCPARCAFGMVI